MGAQTVRFLAPEPGGRLDVVIVTYLADLSRSQVQKLIRSGSVSVNRLVVKKTGYRLDGGEDLQISIPEPTRTDLQPEAIPIDVVYEDQDLLVISKEPGIVVHPSVGHETGTLVQAVLAHAPDIRGIGDEGRPGVVHRLDKDTSGLIIFAKHDEAHQFLQGQFQERQVKKVYYALTDSNPNILSSSSSSYSISSLLSSRLYDQTIRFPCNKNSPLRSSITNSSCISSNNSLIFIYL